MLHDAVEEVLPFNKFLVVNIVVNRAVYKTVSTTSACGRWEWEWCMTGGGSGSGSANASVV